MGTVFRVYKRGRSTLTVEAKTFQNSLPLKSSNCCSTYKIAAAFNRTETTGDGGKLATLVTPSVVQLQGYSVCGALNPKPWGAGLPSSPNELGCSSLDGR